MEINVINNFKAELIKEIKFLYSVVWQQCREHPKLHNQPVAEKIKKIREIILDYELYTSLLPPHLQIEHQKCQYIQKTVYSFTQLCNDITSSEQLSQTLHSIHQLNEIYTQVLKKLLSEENVKLSYHQLNIPHKITPKNQENYLKLRNLGQKMKTLTVLHPTIPLSSHTDQNTNSFPFLPQLQVIKNHTVNETDHDRNDELQYNYITLPLVPESERINNGALLSPYNRFLQGPNGEAQNTRIIAYTTPSVPSNIPHIYLPREKQIALSTKSDINHIHGTNQLLSPNSKSNIPYTTKISENIQINNNNPTFPGINRNQTLNYPLNNKQFAINQAISLNTPNIYTNNNYCIEKSGNVPPLQIYNKNSFSAMEGDQQFNEFKKIATESLKLIKELSDLAMNSLFTSIKGDTDYFFQMSRSTYRSACVCSKILAKNGMASEADDLTQKVVLLISYSKDIYTIPMTSKDELLSVKEKIDFQRADIAMLFKKIFLLFSSTIRPAQNSTEKSEEENSQERMNKRMTRRDTKNRSKLVRPVSRRPKSKKGFNEVNNNDDYSYITLSQPLRAPQTQIQPAPYHNYSSNRVNHISERIGTFRVKHTLEDDVEEGDFPLEEPLTNDNSELYSIPNASNSNNIPTYQSHPFQTPTKLPKLNHSQNLFPLKFGNTRNSRNPSPSTNMHSQFDQSLGQNSPPLESPEVLPLKSLPMQNIYPLSVPLSPTLPQPLSPYSEHSSIRDYIYKDDSMQTLDQGSEYSTKESNKEALFIFKTENNEITQDQQLNVNLNNNDNQRQKMVLKFTGYFDEDELKQNDDTLDQSKVATVSLSSPKVLKQNTSVGSAQIVSNTTPSILLTSPSENTVNKQIEKLYLVTENDQLTKKNQGRMNLYNELLTSEQLYLSNLQLFSEDFLKPLRKNADSEKPLILHSDINNIISSIEQITVKTKEFLKEFKSLLSISAENERLVGGLFLDYTPLLKLYTEYITNYSHAHELIQKRLSDKSQFPSFLHECTRTSKQKKEIFEYLSLPLLHIPHYFTLFNGLIDETNEHHPDYENLCRVVNLLKALNDYIVYKKSEAENRSIVASIQQKIIGFDENWEEKNRDRKRDKIEVPGILRGLSRSLTHQSDPHSKKGSSSENQKEPKKERVYLREGFLEFAISNSKGKKRKKCYFFLFDDILVRTKYSKKKCYYQFIDLFNLSHYYLNEIKASIAPLTKTKGGDRHCFKLTDSENEDFAANFFAQNDVEKKEWLADLEDAIRSSIKIK